MNAIVSQDVCIGCGLCTSTVEEVFRMNDDGKAEVYNLSLIHILDFLSERFNLSGLDFWGKNSLAVMCTHTVFGLRSVAYFGWQKVSYFPSVGSAKYVCQCLSLIHI